ncbi:MAG: adenosylcobinamide-GDP ribazoletransferase [Actinomycetota bacterium]|nr:adenosylcobinamide-GDP ribazoletransferase [Actinomycetota bacterium]
MRAALGFLTQLRVGTSSTPPGPAALVVFPLIGGLLGLVWLVAGTAGTAIGGQLVGAGLVLAVDLLVTGGMHLDAVGDVADGVASRLPPFEAQTVMREPQIGAVGAATLGTTLIVRFALIAAALSVPATLVAAPAAGRAAMVWALGRLPEAPGSIGTALAPLAVPAVRAAAVALVAVVAATALALSGQPPARLVTGGLVAATAAVIISELSARWWARRFGFLSGDAIGAIGIAVELVVLTALLVLAA